MKTVFLSGREDSSQIGVKIAITVVRLSRLAPLHQLVPRFLPSTELDRLFSEKRAHARRAGSNSRLEG